MIEVEPNRKLTDHCGHHCVYSALDRVEIERHCDCNECHGRTKVHQR